MANKQKCIRNGKEMNCIIMKRGFDHRKNVGNPLINMYVNCGCLNETKLVSDRMILKDDISWGSIARGYVQHEDWQLALEIFRKMISEDIIKLNTFILLSMLKACAFRCFTKMVPEGFSPNKVAFLGALKACTLNGDMQVFIVALCSWMGIIINCLEDLRKREIRERWLRTTYAVKSEFAIWLISKVYKR